MGRKEANIESKVPFIIEVSRICIGGQANWGQVESNRWSWQVLSLLYIRKAPRNPSLDGGGGRDICTIRRQGVQRDEFRGGIKRMSLIC